MERAIICKGDSVSLSILAREDAPALYKIINDPEVHVFLSSPSRIYSLVDEYEWIDNTANVFNRSVNFAILENGTKEVVGVIGINPIEENNRGHVGYYISKDHWGKGYGTSALGMIIKFAFETMNLRKLHTCVYKPNVASQRVLEKNGFTRCGVMKENHFVPGYGYADEFIYELMNDRVK